MAVNMAVTMAMMMVDDGEGVIGDFRDPPRLKRSPARAAAGFFLFQLEVEGAAAGNDGEGVVGDFKDPPDLMPAPL